MKRFAKFLVSDIRAPAMVTNVEDPTTRLFNDHDNGRVVETMWWKKLNEIRQAVYVPFLQSVVPRRYIETTVLEEVGPRTPLPRGRVRMKVTVAGPAGLQGFQFPSERQPNPVNNANPQGERKVRIFFFFSFPFPFSTSLCPFSLLNVSHLTVPRVASAPRRSLP